MNPLAKVFASLQSRSKKTIEILEKKISLEFYYLFTVSLLFVFGNLIIYLMLYKKLIIPIRYLTKTILKIRRGETDIERKVFYKDEIGEMNEEFFSMQHVIETNTKDLEKLS